MRTTKNTLRAQVARINTVHNVRLTIAWAYGQPRIHNADGSRDISPRLPAGAMAIWLEGYETALDEAERAGETK